MTTQSLEATDLKSGVIIAINFILCNADPKMYSCFNFKHMLYVLKLVLQMHFLFFQVKTAPECNNNTVHDGLNHTIRIPLTS